MGSLSITDENSEKTGEQKLNQIKQPFVTSDQPSEPGPKSIKTSDALQLLRSVKPADEGALKAEYINKGLDKIPDAFVLYRIIGNNLYPRHEKDQARKNLQFVLENEPELEDCEKRWIVNRIIDKQEEHEIMELLRQHNKPFIHIPFREEEYKAILWDTESLPEPGYLASEHYDALLPEQQNRLIAATYRLKNNYVMNNNGARNIVLREGKSQAKWILPWDGNCFVTRKAWKEICAGVAASPYLKYFVVPMTRVVDNALLLTEEFTPNPVEEPQLIFRMDSREEFYEEFCYGRRPKVELFWRLGIPGKWDWWKDEPWDQARLPLSREAGQFGIAGWVARMFSGMKSLEQDSEKSFKQRGGARRDAIIGTIRLLDTFGTEKSADSKALSIYRFNVLREERDLYLAGGQLPPIGQLITDAGEALTRGPYSVTDKKTLPPSGLANDYWHPAPYWWPNPETIDGLPYIRRDGDRVPGTGLYDPDSDKYDRSRLQRVFDDSIILALAWYFTGEKKYAEHGARILERFFVNAETRMSPHLIYAQVRIGRNNNQGFSTGIIEMKDMYYYLDAVRILESAGALSTEALESFSDWLAAYLEWLVQSPQGQRERNAINNHGTYYDLQVAAIADYLGERSILFETLVRAQSRISCQFASDGSQPEELKRATSAHYCCFNLLGWINMAELASRWGTNLWSYKAKGGASLTKGVQWLLSHADKDWPYPQNGEVDAERYFPIWFAVPRESLEFTAPTIFPASKYEVKPRFFPHDGIRPYWNLGLNQFIGGKKQLELLSKEPEGL